MFEQKEELSLENLCSKEIKIQLTLLNTIYLSTDGLTLDTLVLTTSLSVKTIYKYIRELNNISKKVYKKIQLFFLHIMIFTFITAIKLNF